MNFGVLRKRDIVFLIPYILLLLLGVWYRLHTSGLIFLDGDSGGYFFPPVQKAISGEWHKGERPMQYLLFIYYTLSEKTGIKTTIIAQQVLGILSGLLLAISWIIFISAKKSNKLLWHLLGYAFIDIYVNNAVIMYYEQLIQPESFCFFVMSALICSLLITFSRQFSYSYRYLFISISIFLNLYLFNPLPKWCFISLLADLYFIWLVLKRSGLTVKGNAKIIIIPHIAYFVLVLLPELSHKIDRGDQDRVYIEFEQMVYTHFDLLAQDKSNFGLTPALQDSLITCFKHSSNDGRHLLSFSPDDLMWGNANLLVRKYYHENDDSIEKYFIHLNKLLITRYPLGLIKEIGKQIYGFYFPNRFVQKDLCYNPDVYGSYEGTVVRFAEFDDGMTRLFAMVCNRAGADRSSGYRWLKACLLTPKYPGMITKGSVYDVRQMRSLFARNFLYCRFFDRIFFITMMGYFMIRAYKSRLFKINIITFFYIIIFIYVVTIAIVHTFDVNRFITTINPFILITTFMALVYDMAWGLDGLRALMQKAQFRAFT